MIERLKMRARFVRLDTINLVKYGTRAPRHSETIFIDPTRCTKVIHWEHCQRDNLIRPGRVTPDRFWEGLITPLDDWWKMEGLIEHFTEGLPWEETASYREIVDRLDERPGFDGCWTMDDVRRRYATLDAIFDEARRTGRMMTPKEFDPRNLRASGAVRVFIIEGGEPVFARSGLHRLTIARILRIPLPATAALIYEGALGEYDAMRRELVTVRPREPRPAMSREVVM